MTKARDIADFKFEDIVDTGTEGTKVASGTTAQRGSTTGQIRFNSTTGLAEYYTGTAFKTIYHTPPIDGTVRYSIAGGIVLSLAKHVVNCCASCIMLLDSTYQRELRCRHINEL